MAKSKKAQKPAKKAAKKPVKAKKEELSDKDLDKVAGGGWIDLNKV